MRKNERSSEREEEREVLFCELSTKNNKKPVVFYEK